MTSYSMLISTFYFTFTLPIWCCFFINLAIFNNERFENILKVILKVLYFIIIIHNDDSFEDTFDTVKTTFLEEMKN